MKCSICGLGEDGLLHLSAEECAENMAKNLLRTCADPSEHHDYDPVIHLTITPAQKASLDFLLENILDPIMDNPVISDYRGYDLITEDSGFYAGEDPTDEDLKVKRNEWEDMLTAAMGTLRYLTKEESN